MGGTSAPTRQGGGPSAPTSSDGGRRGPRGTGAGGEQGGQLVLEHRADPLAERLGLVGGVRAARPRSGRRCRGARRSSARTCWARAISGAWSRSRCTIALAPSGGSGESQACCAAMTRSAGSSASAPPPLPSPSMRHSVGASRRDQVGQAAGDLAGQPAVLGRGGERRALGVDDGHQRQPQLGGQPHAAPGLAQRLGTHRVVRGLPAPVLAEEDARRARRTAPARSAAPGRPRPGRCR